MAGEEIILVFKWVVFATSMLLLAQYVYQMLRGSRAGFFRYLIPLSAILINYEEFFFAELFMEEKYYFLSLISAMGKETLLINIIGIKALTIFLTLLCFLFHRFQFVNKYLEILILSILVAYGTTNYGVTISTGNYVPGLISSIIFVLPVWLASMKYSLKRFISIFRLSVIIILGFLFNALYFVNILTIFSI